LVTLAGRLAKKNELVADENATFPIPDRFGPQHLPWGSESRLRVNDNKPIAKDRLPPRADAQGEAAIAARFMVTPGWPFFAGKITRCARVS
jgi:hypothetical protein